MATKIFLRCCKHKLFAQRHRVQLQATANKFFEPDHRGEGYPSPVKNPGLQKLARNMRDFVPELKKYTEEQWTKWRMDSVIPRLPGDYEILWKFDTQKSVQDWITTVDSDHNEGFSRAQFEFGKNNTGIFHGYVDVTLPKDGRTDYAGYANIRGPELFKFFNRQIPYDWTHYNTLMLRIRGDGRPYRVIVQLLREYDLLWFDQYHYPLYTRGGPYWQETFIPFNKFYLTSKGRIQNIQENFLTSHLERIKFLGITLSDGYTGPFHLEIDYIGLYYDASLNEEFVYEMYDVPAYKIYD